MAWFLAILTPLAFLALLFGVRQALRWWTRDVEADLFDAVSVCIRAVAIGICLACVVVLCHMGWEWVLA